MNKNALSKKRFYIIISLSKKYVDKCTFITYKTYDNIHYFLIVQK